MEEKILGGIFGLCTADSVGVPFEFRSRESLARAPVTDMCGYGTYNQPAGTWSDDTSMTLCLLDSLSKGLDYTDIMQRFLLWLDKAKYTPHNEVFDVGRTSREAIFRFTQGVLPLRCGGASEHDNGNGALMRILPLVFYLHSRFGHDFFENEEAITNGSKIYTNNKYALAPRPLQIRRSILSVRVQGTPFLRCFPAPASPSAALSLRVLSLWVLPVPVLGLAARYLRRTAAPTFPSCCSLHRRKAAQGTSSVPAAARLIFSSCLRSLSCFRDFCRSKRLVRLSQRFSLWGWYSLSRPPWAFP